MSQSEPRPTLEETPNRQPVPSPAPIWLRSVVAAVFASIWLIVVLIDFFTGGSRVPLWFQATGLVVLGYLLGVGVGDLRSLRR